MWHWWLAHQCEEGPASAGWPGLLLSEAKSACRRIIRVASKSERQAQRKKEILGGPDNSLSGSRAPASDKRKGKKILGRERQRATSAKGKKSWVARTTGCPGRERQRATSAKGSPGADYPRRPSRLRLRRPDCKQSGPPADNPTSQRRRATSAKEKRNPGWPGQLVVRVTSVSERQARREAPGPIIPGGLPACAFGAPIASNRGHPRTRCPGRERHRATSATPPTAPPQPEPCLTPAPHAPKCTVDWPRVACLKAYEAQGAPRPP